MTPGLRILFALLAMCVVECAFAGEPTDGRERVLVTVHSDVVDEMYGDVVERYHRPHDYRAQPNAGRILDALAADYGIRRVGGWPMRTLALRCEAFALAPGTDAEALIVRLARDKRVDSAQMMHRFHTLTDAHASYRRLQYALDELDIDQAHAISLGRDTRVAVIDSGIDADHPDLRGAVAIQRDFSGGAPAAHGTEMAGVIAARRGIVGVAPEAQLLDLRACWADGSGDAADCDSYSLAQALDFAIVNGADVINLSLAGPNDALLTRLLKVADAHAISVVAAEPPTRDAAHAFPSSVRSVIVVGVDGNPASHAPLNAPGTDVLTTFPGGRCDYASGSSIAAAEVSGVVALARSLQRRIKPEQMQVLLTKHTPLSAAGVLAELPVLH